ncbi:hypothetical protein EI94DRAFT_1792066 [Lactarius quietus]|nr:hypothetical protein EI94DRAFT_1792066 [Lactarius quietus]
MYFPSLFAVIVLIASAVAPALADGQQHSSYVVTSPLDPAKSADICTAHPPLPLMLLPQQIRDEQGSMPEYQEGCETRRSGSGSRIALAISPAMTWNPLDYLERHGDTYLQCLLLIS